MSLCNETAIARRLFGGLDVILRGRVSVGAELTLGARPSAQVQVGGVVF